MSRMNPTQQGMAGQLLLAAAVVIGSHGRVKAGFQTTDDEGRDVTVHLGGKFAREWAIQVKTATRLRPTGRHEQLTITVHLTRENVIDSPRYWYVFGHLNADTASFSEFVFLVPSRFVHAHLTTDPEDGTPLLSFQASMAEDADDRWTRYRLRVGELGARLESLLEGRRAGAFELDALGRLPGVCWLGRDLTVAAKAADRAQRLDRLRQQS